MSKRTIILAALSILFVIAAVLSVYFEKRQVENELEIASANAREADLKAEQEQTEKVQEDDQTEDESTT